MWCLQSIDYWQVEALSDGPRRPRRPFGLPPPFRGEYHADATHSKCISSACVKIWPLTNYIIMLLYLLCCHCVLNDSCSFLCLCVFSVCLFILSFLLLDMVNSQYLSLAYPYWVGSGWVTKKWPMSNSGADVCFIVTVSFSVSNNHRHRIVIHDVYGNNHLSSAARRNRPGLQVSLNPGIQASPPGTCLVSCCWFGSCRQREGGRARPPITSLWLPLPAPPSSPRPLTSPPLFALQQSIVMARLHREFTHRIFYAGKSFDYLSQLS